MFDKNYHNLDECLEIALEKGNHEAIAKTLIKKNISRKQNFLRILGRFMKNSFHINGWADYGRESLIHLLHHFALVKSEYWNSYTFELDGETGRYQKQTIRKWIDREILPDREAIIQISLCMGWTVEDANLLLRSAGYTALYYPDMADLCAIFYLNKNQSHDVLSWEQFCDVKKSLNDKLKFIENMPPKSTSKKKQNMKKPAYSQKIRTKLHQNIEIFFNSNFAALIESDAKFTSYIEKEYLSNVITNEDFEIFVKTYLPYLGEIHYGISQIFENYLMDSQSYRKNIYYYQGSFTVDDEGELLESMEWNEENEIVVGLEDLFGKDSITNKKSILSTLLSLEYKHIMGEEEINIKGVGSFNTLSMFFDGRIEKDSQENKKHYLYQFPSKVLIFRLLAAMGKEDDIANMMIRAGYWDHDWIADKNIDQCDYLDYSDWLIIYMIRYRNRLMKEWAKIIEKDPVIFHNQNRTIFPFAVSI